MITLHFHLQPQYKYELLHIKLHKTTLVQLFSKSITEKKVGCIVLVIYCSFTKFNNRQTEVGSVVFAIKIHREKW